MSATNLNRVKINGKPKLPYAEAHSKTRPEKVKYKRRGGSFDWNDYSK